MSDRVFTGPCDVCGQMFGETIPAHRVVDLYIDDADTPWTWMRHIEGPDPDCAVISSKVMETRTVPSIPAQVPEPTSYFIEVLADSPLAYYILGDADARPWNAKAPRRLHEGDDGA